MKRVIILAAAVLVSTMGTLQAQIKFDEAGLKAKVEKAKVASEHAKKATKGATWIALGDAYYEIATTPTVGLYKGLDEMSAQLLLSPSQESTEVIGGVEYKKWIFPYYDVYLSGGSVVFWDVKKEVVPGAITEAIKAYNKAYEVDKASAAKVKAALKRVADTYKESAQNNFSGQKYAKGGADFAAAYEVQKAEAVGELDTLAGFNAGFMYVLGGEFEKSVDYLKEALEIGYDNAGDTYYYLFHSYFGMKDYASAKAVLLQGIEKYPTNNELVEGFMGLYAETKEDPNEVIPYVEKAIAADPQNAELYAGMGRVYNQLGNIDEAIKSFTKALELTPEDFGANYNLGYVCIRKADAMAEEMNEKQITSQDEYDAELAKVYAAYAVAIPYLEKAHELDTKDAGTVELLRGVYFRMRDESPAYMDGYNKYDKLFKEM